MINDATLRDAATHLIMGISGPTLSKEEGAFIRRFQPAGIVLFSRNWVDLVQLNLLIVAIGEQADVAPTIWIDQEGGRVQRLRDPLTRYPSPWVYARQWEEDPAQAMRAAREAGWLCAAELWSLGIGVNCAPVLDVGEEGADPVIGERAFARDPWQVTQLAGAWLAGLTQGGVMGVGKHFPGHGAARADSHRCLPVVDKGSAALQAWEWIPFRALLSGLPAIMTAHLVVSGLDPDYPATWSSRLLTGVLRGEWGYEGLIVADALEMGALSGSMAERSRRALAAGCDLVLCCTGCLEDAREALLGLAASGRSAESSGRSRERILGVLANYRPVPGRWERLREDPRYGRIRAEVEARAGEVAVADPTEGWSPAAC